MVFCGGANLVCFARDILRWSQNLQQIGIDTTEIKENLQESALVISSNLNALLQGTPSIKVNEHDFSVGDALTEKYLAEGRQLLLEGGNETED